MIIFDHRQKSLSHSKGNAYIIKTISEKYPNETIHLFLEQSHYDEILKIYDTHNIKLHNILFHPLQINLNVGYRLYHYILQDFITILTINKFIKNNETTIFSLYTSNVQLYFIQIMAIMNPNINFYTMIHSDLELIDLSKYKTNLKLLLYYLFMSIYIPLHICKIKNLKYYVLGESVKTNMLKLLPKLADNVLSFDNNYIFQEKFDFTPFKDNKIKFGIFGMVHPNANGTTLTQLFKKISNLKNKNFEFHFIGHLRSQELIDEFSKYDFVKIYAKNNEFLSDKMLTELGKNVDYGIYGHLADSYKLTASGAFWDSFSFFKPVIAIRNDYFGYYFDKYGDIGYCCNDFEELLEKVLYIIKNPNNEAYRLQVKSIEKMREDLDSHSKENLTL